MRGSLIFLVFVLTLVGVSYFLLNQQGLWGEEGVDLLWTLRATPEPPARERVDPTPLAALLREEAAAVEEARVNLDREREQFAVERESLDAQREAMAAELEAVRRYREELDRQQEANVAALSRMLSTMDAAAAAQIVEKLPERLAVTVLLESKQRESGAILEEMNPEKAALLSERIARADLPAS